MGSDIPTDIAMCARSVGMFSYATVFIPLAVDPEKSNSSLAVDV